MVQDIPPPTDVLTLVFLAWAAGHMAFGAISRLWSEIGSGHFKVVWLAGAGLFGAAGFGYRPAWIIFTACVLTFAAIYRGYDRLVAIATAIAGLAVLGLHGPAYGYAVAALLGAVTNAMLLGHWHLNQPRLGTQPIARLVRMLWGAIVAFVLASVALLVFGPDDVLLFAAATGIGFAIFSGVLTAMVQHLVKTRSIMSATGILYLEILLIFVASFTGSLGALSGT